MKFDTDLGYALMHLYLTLHPKKSPAYDPTEEGYISQVEEAVIHHFAEFLRFSDRVLLQKAQQNTVAAKHSQEVGWQDFTNLFTNNVNGDIEFDANELSDVFNKFKMDVSRIINRPHTQLEIELAKTLNQLQITN